MLKGQRHYISSHHGHVAYVLIALLIGYLAGYPLGRAYEANRGADTSFDEAVSSFFGKVTTKPVPESRFDVTRVKVGDAVAGMKLVSIQPFTEHSHLTGSDSSNEPISTTNVHAVFSGEATVTGTVTGYDSTFSGQHMICVAHLDDQSKKRIPSLDGLYRFCLLSILADPATVFPGNGTWQATIVISDYVLDSFPADVLNTATFVRSVSQTKIK